ncbi:Hypothetical protein NGAL_HAMBI2605_62740 [Neorhizobium galegae bv. orientalis]|nr:Hypothetical protein NGAL_HAMBI2605_62740 [Neorhizobium galegae bv. orientalis]
MVTAVLLRDINKAYRFEFTSDEDTAIKRITKKLLEVKAYQDEKDEQRKLVAAQYAKYVQEMKAESKALPRSELDQARLPPVR